ncbi:MAG: glycine cleavage system protein GcvH [Pseudomonadota bacterium]
MSVKYTEDHEWVSVEGDIATFGITDHAQEQLGELVFIELPEAGTELKKGGEAAVVESVKAASDVYAPVSGEVIETNSGLDSEPTKVNEDPEGSGWMIKIKLSDVSELDGMLDKEAYSKLIS